LPRKRQDSIFPNARFAANRKKRSCNITRIFFFN
jgi:hypothetical protein